MELPPSSLEVSTRSLLTVDTPIAGLAPIGAIESSEDEYAEDDQDSGHDSDASLVNFTGFHRLCYVCGEGPRDPRWKTVLAHLRELRSYGAAHARAAAETEQKGIVPLSLVCERRPPRAVVAALIDASPATTAWRDEQDNTPLHTACQCGADVDVLRTLARRHPDGPVAAREARTESGTTPLQLLVYEHGHGREPPDPKLYAALMTPDVMLLEDGFGRTPLGLLRTYAKDLLPHETEARRRCEDIVDIFLDARPRGTSSFLTHVARMPCWLQDRALRHSHLRRVLNRRIARRFTTYLLMTDFLAQSVVIATYSQAIQYAVMRRERRNVVDTGDDFYYRACLEVLIVANAYLVVREVTQFLSHSSKSWLSDGWNWLDVAQIALLGYSIKIMWPLEPIVDLADRFALVITCGVVWVMMLSFLKSTYVPFAVFVTGLLHTTVVLLPFITTTLFLLGAFSFMFYAQVNTSKNNHLCADPEHDISFCHRDASYIKTYTLFVSGSMGDPISDREIRETIPLSILFSFVVVVLLLNVLIAIVNQAYDAVDRKGVAVFWALRLDFVAEIAAMERLFDRLCRCRLLGGASGSSDPDHDRRAEEREERRAHADERYEHLLRGTSVGRRSLAPLDDVDEGRLLWDALVLALVRRRESSREVLREEILVSECDGGRYADLLRRPLWYRRAVALTLLPPWALSGLLTCGVTWPPQMRERLFCPRVVTEEEEDARASERENNDDDEDESAATTYETTARLEGEVRTLRDELRGARAEVGALRQDLTARMASMSQLLLLLNKTNFPPPPFPPPPGNAPNHHHHHPNNNSNNNNNHPIV